MSSVVNDNSSLQSKPINDRFSDEVPNFLINDLNQGLNLHPLHEIINHNDQKFSLTPVCGNDSRMSIPHMVKGHKMMIDASSVVDLH